MYVSSFCYRCVLILLCMCPHAAAINAHLHMCPHTATYVPSYCSICDLILLYMCPDTALYVSACCSDQRSASVDSRARVLSYCSICDLILLDMSSYCYICVLILLYMCPHAAAINAHLASILEQGWRRDDGPSSLLHI
jgi:hypothetical protein